METDQVWREIDAARESFAALLDDLSPAEWAVPSLCTEWRVREVAAHLTLAHTGWGTGLREFARARGSFNRMIRDTAVRQAVLPVDAYALLIRAMAGTRRKAPTVTPMEPLIDALVHSQDVAVPLGRDHPASAPAAAAAATRAYTMAWPFFARRRLAGLELVATDHPWRAGAGRRVEGRMIDLLLLVTGRTATAGRLTGPGAARLA